MLSIFLGKGGNFLPTGTDSVALGAQRWIVTSACLRSFFANF